MVGKGALIVILGFSMIFGVASQYWNRNSDRAIENFVNYYDSTYAHVMAISAINILADSLFWNQGSADLTNIDIPSVSFRGGSFSMSTEPDTLDGEYIVIATAVSNYAGYRGRVIRDSVQILLQPGRFNQWAYFTDKDSNIYWATGETLDGRYHTNGTLYLDGAPVFKDNVSTGRGLTTLQRAPTLVSPNKLPDSYGNKLIAPSYQSGVIIPMPNSLANYTQVQNIKLLTDTTYKGSSYAYDVFVTFAGASMSYYTTVSKVTTSYGVTTITQVGRTPATGTTNIALNNLGDANYNGLGSVVVIQDGDLHVSGSVNGRVSLVAIQGSGTTARVSSSSYGKVEGVSTDVDMTYGNGTGNHNSGNIIIDGNTVYTNKPTSLDDATNLLGLVADNSIAVAKQTTADLEIDASLFARQGKFFNSMYKTSSRGTLTLFGSMAQKTRGAVGLVGTAGYTKNYSYDARFARTKTSPPMSPSTGSYNIVSWRE